MEKVRLHACLLHILKNLWDILFHISNSLSQTSSMSKFIKSSLYYKFAYFHSSKHHNNTCKISLWSILYIWPPEQNPALWNRQERR